MSFFRICLETSLAIQHHLYPLSSPKNIWDCILLSHSFFVRVNLMLNQFKILKLPTRYYSAPLYPSLVACYFRLRSLHFVPNRWGEVERCGRVYEPSVAFLQKWLLSKLLVAEIFGLEPKSGFIPTPPFQDGRLPISVYLLLKVCTNIPRFFYCFILFTFEKISTRVY